MDSATKIDYTALVYRCEGCGIEWRRTLSSGDFALIEKVDTNWFDETGQPAKAWPETVVRAVSDAIVAQHNDDLRTQVVSMLEALVAVTDVGAMLPPVLCDHVCSTCQGVGFLYRGEADPTYLGPTHHHDVCATCNGTGK